MFIQSNFLFKKYSPQLKSFWSTLKLNASTADSSIILGKIKIFQVNRPILSGHIREHTYKFQWKQINKELIIIFLPIIWKNAATHRTIDGILGFKAAIKLFKIINTKPAINVKIASKVKARTVLMNFQKSSASRSVQRSMVREQ